MRLRKFFALALVFVMCASLFVGCGGGGGTEETGGGGAAGDERTSIKIGIPNPTTGPLADFGEGTPWAEELAIKPINDDGGIYIEEYDKKLPIELVFIDTESDSTKASEVTQKLIVDEGVDLLIARHTPDTALPVSAMGERYGVPVISTECPIDPWKAGGPYEWAFHAFWTIDSVYELYRDSWVEAGLQGKTVGLLFPNDPDGLAWAPVFAERLPQDGYKVSDPGRYPIGNSDWSSVINQFKQDGVEIIAGCNIPPDFANFMKQASQLGFEPIFSSQGRSILFNASATAMGPELADGQTIEVWWSPHHPYPSSITGQTAKDILELYTQESGRVWTATIGYKYAPVEIAIDVLKRCKNLEPETIRDAIAETDMVTVVGPIKYNEDHLAFTPIVLGQWTLQDDGTLDVEIVNNWKNSEIPETGEIRLMK
ncbi:MAG: ABC transporter substrate-binding protein [Clostridiales bacterium]|jgi:branched-chain amino acid transport system substrate-binding protein|nr:ABC transporter substrate-binding protein [Clostridiales bacterium]